jgi:hypothetical protein
MKPIVVIFGVLLAAIWSPIVGSYAAIVVIAASAVPVLTVHEKIAPLSDKIGSVVGQPSVNVTVGLIVSIALAVVTFCLVRAAFDPQQRRANEFAGAATTVLGMLAVVFSSYLRFKFPNW